ncbi:SDR family oxidoreductase [Leucobacter luti]|uniref:SDR family oxidoreductase n=1 Tax=Leucobacter luti TaxID=340320 RepID=UPI00104B83DA|nr:SDR family oxidoreductase [Leucobacter luti]MCW2288646.1 NAD(P)-dependent dehydrogenase (short-subunit alcohol dehydrogenase family) [Leucobacter luti]QYM75426.1 SDR family oxidoreductase [Leucobacter luti]TCK45198.1 NAD(P)-dependent dehydrogenase (short-subunit alcohol dehydrogenase family) [Leucobacter luti]
MSRTYVVTGAASGIGKTTTQILRAAGNTVIGVDLAGVEVSGDLSHREGRLTAAAEATRLANGTVDAVIACAGLSIPKPVTAAVNYFGMTEFLEAMQPALTTSPAPRVALISSMASLQPVAPPLVEALLQDDEQAALAIAEQLAGDPQTGNLIYSSSKQAVSRWVRREAPKALWAGAGIPLNAVGPGTVITPMTQELLASEDGRKLVDSVVPMPLNSHQAPESIANLLIWLTSVENTHCCGQTIYCDGGADVVLRGDDIWSWNEAGIRDTFARIQGAH